MDDVESDDFSISHYQYHAGEVRVWCVSENVFPMLPQGLTPPGTVPAVTSVSICNTLATPSSFILKNDPRGLSVFKQEKQKVCFRELRYKESTSVTSYITVVIGVIRVLS